MALAVAPVAAHALTADLHAPHVGVSSESFTKDSDDGGLSAKVVWHFVLNGLDKGTPAGEITVTFAGAGTRTATGRVVGRGGTQHFYIGTPGHDVLRGAVALVESSGYNKLVLSHVAYKDVPKDEPEDPKEEPEEPREDPEEPIVDPTPEPEPDTTPGVLPPEAERAEEDPFLPFTEAVEADEEEEFLPFTGAQVELLLAAVAVFTAAGFGLRRFALGTARVRPVQRM